MLIHKKHNNLLSTLATIENLHLNSPGLKLIPFGDRIRFNQTTEVLFNSEYQLIILIKVIFNPLLTDESQKMKQVTINSKQIINEMAFSLR